MRVFFFNYPLPPPMNYLYSSFTGLFARPASEKNSPTTVDGQIADLQKTATELEKRVLRREKAFYTERSTAAKLNKERRVTEARQALVRSKAIEKQMAVMRNSASQCWCLAMHLESLGIMADSYQAMASSNNMIRKLMKTEGLDPDKVAELSEQLQASVGASTEIQDLLSRPLDAAAAAGGDMDYDALDAELATLNDLDEIAAADLASSAMSDPAKHVKQRTTEAVRGSSMTPITEDTSAAAMTEPPKPATRQFYLPASISGTGEARVLQIARQ